MFLLCHSHEVRKAKSMFNIQTLELNTYTGRKSAIPLVFVSGLLNCFVGIKAISILF